MLFFDEFDSIALSRAHMENDPAARRLLTQWLVQMNSMKKSDDFLVLAATNRPEGQHARNVAMYWLPGLTSKSMSQEAGARAPGCSTQDIHV